MAKNSYHKAPKKPPVMHLLEYIGGKSYTYLIAVVAELGIADLLADGPKSVKELSEATETHAPSLYRVLRVLDRMGVFTEDPEEVFSLTSISKLLKTDSPIGLRDWAILNGSEWHGRSWNNLLYSVKTGKPSFWEIYGMKGFEYFQKNPKDSAVLSKAMTFLTKGEAIPVLNSYDFSKFQKIADIGGGHGYLLSLILKKNPNLRGILFDLPEVIEGGRKLMKEANLLERCEIIGGNFFKTVPKGCDLYFLKYIIHDWSDENALKILQNCRDAISPDGKLVVVDKIINLKSRLEDHIIGDIEMMILGEGRERTETEFRKLFTKSGFRLIKIIPTEIPLFILELEPI